MPRVSSVQTPIAHLVGPGKLKVINEQLAFSIQGKPLLRLDPKGLQYIYCYGNISVSDAAFHLLFKHDIDLTWLSPGGHKVHGRLIRAQRSTVALRVLQHRVFANPKQIRRWAQQIVSQKIESQFLAARYYQQQGIGDLGASLEQLARLMQASSQAQDLDSLRGYEGSASVIWFGVLGRLLLPPWKFENRVRRPPTDPVNALLSLGYTWLLNRTIAASEAVGLEVALGGLHALHPGRPSLACDLMEPFRVPVVDRWVVSRLNRREMVLSDFVCHEQGVTIQPTAFGKTLHSWEQHWLESGFQEKMDQTIARLIQWLRKEEPSMVSPNEE